MESKLVTPPLTVIFDPPVPEVASVPQIIAPTELVSNASVQFGKLNRNASTKIPPVKVEVPVP